MTTEDRRDWAGILVNLGLVAVIGAVLINSSGPIGEWFSRWKARQGYRATVAGLWADAVSDSSYRLTSASGFTDGVDAIEFIDYECPYCRSSVALVEGMLDAGDFSSLTILQYPLASLHPRAVAAATAALCASRQGQFAAVHDALLGEEAWRNSDEALNDLIERVGLDQEQYHRCSESAWVETELARHKRIAETLGVRGTPAFASEQGFVRGAMGPERIDELR